MNRAWIACMALCGVVTGAVAQDKPEDNVQVALSLGVTLTDGNSETLQANASIATEGEKEGFGSFRTGGEANYGEGTVDDQISHLDRAPTDPTPTPVSDCPRLPTFGPPAPHATRQRRAVLR